MPESRPARPVPAPHVVRRLDLGLGLGLDFGSGLVLGLGSGLGLGFLAGFVIEVGGWG